MVPKEPNRNVTLNLLSLCCYQIEAQQTQVWNKKKTQTGLFVCKELSKILVSWTHSTAHETWNSELSCSHVRMSFVFENWFRCTTFWDLQCSFTIVFIAFNVTVYRKNFMNWEGNWRQCMNKYTDCFILYTKLSWFHCVCGKLYLQGSFYPEKLRNNK